MVAMVKVRRYLEVSVEDFGERLKEARIKDGRSVQLLATLSNISLGYWYQLEKEERTWISEGVLREIESTLGIDFQVTFDHAQVMTDSGIAQKKGKDDLDQLRKEGR